MEADSFAFRLAYVRWLRSRGRLKPETDAELAKAARVGLPWLTKWKSRDDAPNDRAITKKFAQALGTSDDWLIDNVGDPPSPALWRAWIGAADLDGRAPARSSAERPWPRSPIGKAVSELAHSYAIRTAAGASAAELRQIRRELKERVAKVLRDERIAEDFTNLLIDGAVPPAQPREKKASTSDAKH